MEDEKNYSEKHHNRPSNANQSKMMFASSYSSVQQTIKKAKPSKWAEMQFVKKIRSMRKKIKYLTEAEQSQFQPMRPRRSMTSEQEEIQFEKQQSGRMKHKINNFKKNKERPDIFENSSNRQTPHNRVESQKSSTKNQPPFRKLVKLNEQNQCSPQENLIQEIDIHSYQFINQEFDKNQDHNKEQYVQVNRKESEQQDLNISWSSRHKFEQKMQD